jgi:hypothetical protein
VNKPAVDLTFSHNWQAEILPARPLILPPRHFVYPAQADEVERGALEVLIRPVSIQPVAAVGQGFIPGKKPAESTGPSALEVNPQPFLATCALGFRDPAIPTGIWSCPNPDEICAVSGGYAYIIDTVDPHRFSMIPFRPVLQVFTAPQESLLLFVSHHAVLAWGVTGQAWQSEKLSDEGITITSTVSGQIHGQGWNMITDKEVPFTLDLKTGHKAGLHG